MGEIREYVLLLDRGGPLAVNRKIVLVSDTICASGTGDTSAEGGLLREAKVGL